MLFVPFKLRTYILCWVKFVAFILSRVNTRGIVCVLVTQCKIEDLISNGLESDTVTVLSIFEIKTLKPIYLRARFSSAFLITYNHPFKSVN